jgi:hypothetical protein
MSRSRYPDFLGIGSQKTGTSWLYRNLRAHPDVWLPNVKELHYFDQKIERQRRDVRGKLFGKEHVHARWRNQFSRRLVRRELGRPTLADLHWYARYFFGRPSDSWYAALFDPAGDRLAGEITPSYAPLPAERVEHIHRLMPDAKLIFFVRNPIERAWSQAKMFQAKKRVREAGLIRNLESDQSAARNDYLRTLDVWTSFYPAERIFVGFLEDVRFHPEELLAELYAFLGVRDVGPSKYTRTAVNQGSSSTIPGPIVGRLAERYGELIDRLPETFGVYASWWQFTRERLAELDGAEDVPYPFHETPLWEEWLARSGNGAPPLQSCTLPRLAGRPAPTP